MKLEIKDKEYVLKLTTKAIVETEERLGCNIIDIFAEVDSGHLPKLKDLLIIFHEAMRYTHGIKFDDVFDIYSDYIEEGHTYPDFVVMLLNVMRDSGLLPKESEEEDSKN